MTDINAANSGTFMIGGDLEVNRLGFGGGLHNNEIGCAHGRISCS